MKHAKQRFIEYTQQRLQQTCNKLCAIAIDKMDYPDFDPDRAEQLTRELLACGRLSIAPEGMKGLCV
jgi:hypothetical protein